MTPAVKVCFDVLRLIVYKYVHVNYYILLFQVFKLTLFALLMTCT